MIKEKTTAIEILSHHVDKKDMTEVEAKRILSLPMVDIPPFRNTDKNEWSDFLETEKANDKDSSSPNRDDFFLLEASYWIPHFGLYVFKIKPELLVNDYGSLPLEFICFTGRPKGEEATIIYGDLVLDEVNLSIDITNMRISTQGEKVDWEAIKSEDLAEAVMAHLLRGLTTIHYFAMFQNTLDLYPVIRQRKSPKKLIVGANKTKKRLENTLANGPRVIFLNELPSDKGGDIKTHGSEVETTRKMHQRRGHWKTLRHERYAKHPKYLVEKAIRVKPAFVGKLEGECNGNVYKVILPQDGGLIDIDAK